jgi:serine phosphatase RsbU (regulator of sigma subunit)
VPISAKLTLATTIVVAAAVAASSWFGQKTIAELAQTQGEVRRVSGERAIIRESELVAKAVANAVALPLAQNAYPDIKPVLDAALRDDRARSDRRLGWLLVTDASGQVVMATDGAPSGAALAELERVLAAATAAAPAAGDTVAHGRIGHGADWVYGTPILLGDHAVGALRIGVTTAGLEAELASALAAAAAEARHSRDEVWIAAGAILALGLLFAFVQGAQLARPIRALATQAHRIAGGDLEHRVPATRRDELGELARNFNFMADRIGELLVEQAAKASLEKEMDLARMVQQSMLPPHTLDGHGVLKVVGYCAPASSCGGDWWMYRKLSGGRMLVVLGDATGHGIHSAMIAATARGAVEALSSVDERLLTPEQSLRAIDAAIRNVGEHNVIMTAFAAVFDGATGVLHYANAGQNFPYVMRLGATRLVEDANIIAAAGNPLGDRQIQVEIRRGSLQLQPGDLFVCFTDGLVERANPAGKLFGDRRLRNSLKGQPLPDGPALVTLRDHVLALVEAHAAGEVASDDITFVLCQYDPPVSRPQAGAGLVGGRGAA